MDSEAYKTRLAYITERISAQNNLMLLLNILSLKYKADLNRRIKFVCVAMCSLVMSPCSRDLLVTSLNSITKIE